MATCPECDAEIEIDEFDVDKGDLISCPECGSNLEVTTTSPVELEAVDEDDDDEDDDDDEVKDEDDDRRGRRRRRRRRCGRGGLGGVTPGSELAGPELAGPDRSIVLERQDGRKPDPKHERDFETNEDVKERALFDTLAAWPALIVAYSGGVDSAYLAWAATRVLGREALCITADSPSYPERHRALARQIAQDFGFAHEIIHTNEMERPEYRANPANRCYYCKHELYTHLSAIARAARHSRRSPTEATPMTAATIVRDARPRRNSGSSARSMRSASRRRRSASCRTEPGCRRGTNPRRRVCRRAFRISARSPTTSCG